MDRSVFIRFPYRSKAKFHARVYKHWPRLNFGIEWIPDGDFGNMLVLALNFGPFALVFEYFRG